MTYRLIDTDTGQIIAGTRGDLGDVMGDERVCADCFSWVDDGAELTETDVECAGDPYFSQSDCDSCGTGLGGNRYPAHGVIDGKTYHFDVCTDCYMYLANGDLPDTGPGQFPTYHR